jgi:PAS domain S-box-containing protein
MTLKDLKQESDKESPNKYIEEMELNEKHLSLIYDTLSDVVFLLAVEPDDCFRFMSLNQAFSDATGLTREQVVGKRIEQVLPETAHALVISKYKEAIVDNKTVFWEQASTFTTGERVGAMTVTPVRTAEGVCTHLVGTVHDITERKQAEEQNRFLSSVVEQSADGMAIADMEGNLLFVNDTWVSMHGYEKAEELLGQNLSIFHNEEQLKDDVEPFNRKVQEKGHYTGEVGHIRKDSTIFPTQMTTILLRDENDNPIAIAGAATDITERKEAEEVLRRAHENIKTILEKAPFGVVVIGRDRKIKRVNDTALKMAGVENADVMLGRNCGEYLCPAQQKECPILDKGQQVDNSERIFRNKDGKEIPIIKTVTEINIDGEDVLLEIFIDNSERKRVEEALAAEAIHRRILMEQSRDGIVILNQDGSVYESNQRFAKMLGFSPEEVSHLHVWDWDFQFTHEQLRDMLRNVNDAGDAFETQHRRKDGTIYDVEISTNGAVFAGEKLIFCVCRDITGRKMAEAELQKLNDELEQRVTERTAELEEKNKELEHMNRVFVGRELRMAELKKQIAELEKDADHNKKAGDKTT